MRNPLFFNFNNCRKEEKLIFKLLYNGYELSATEIHRIICNDLFLLKLQNIMNIYSIEYVMEYSFLLLNANLNFLIINNLIVLEDGVYHLHQSIINFKRNNMIQNIEKL